MIPSRRVRVALPGHLLEASFGRHIARGTSGFLTAMTYAISRPLHVACGRRAWSAPRGPSRSAR